MNQEHLSPHSLKIVLSALARAQRKISEKKRAKEDVAGHLEKIREASSRTTKKSIILEEIQKLEAKVNDLIEKHTEEKEMMRKLQERHGIEKLKHPVKSLGDFERISWKLGENVQKLKKIENEEKPKIEIVEINKNKQEELKEIEKQLKLLEVKYNKLKKSKKHKTSDLKRLETMIKKYKGIIQEIKSK